MSSVLDTTETSPLTHTASDPVRFVAVRANLMPAEVLSARRAEVVRRRVLLGLAALTVALVGVYGLSWWQTHAARNDLAAVQREGVHLQNDTARFAPIVSAQATTASLQSQLQKLMVGDLSWDGMLNTLRGHAPAGVQLTQIAGTITSGAAGAGQGTGNANSGPGFQALAQSGQQAVGSLTLTGTARDQRSVANYADALGTVKGLAAAFVTSVATSGSTTTFAMTVPITSEALGGRYAVPAAGTAAGPTTTTSTGGR